jgi:hypothetical protein
MPNGFFDAYNGMTATQNLSDYEIRTIREGDMIVERKSKSDSLNTNSYPITFPDTIADAQTQHQRQQQLQPQPQQLQKPHLQQKPRTIAPPDRNIDRRHDNARPKSLELQKNELAK